MPTLEYALLSDFWRRGRWSFSLMLLGLTGLMLLIYGPLWNAGGLPPGKVAVSMHVVFTLVFCFCGLTTMFVAQGKVARFYSRPISTTRLVVCQLTAGVLSVGLFYLSAAGLLNLLVAANWPLWGPALFLVATAACLQAAVWWNDKSVAAQFIACAATSTPLCIWFARRYGATIFGDWHEMWTAITAAELITLASLIAGAYGAAIWGVTRQRRGESFNLEALVTSWTDWLAAGSRRASRFASAGTAQFWYEWRQKHGAVPAMVMALTVLVIVAPYAAGFMEAREMFETLTSLPLVFGAFIIPVVYGLVLGNCGTSNRMFGMRHLTATRPVSSHSLAKSMLSVGAAVIGLAWLTHLAGLAIAAAIAFRLGHGDAVGEALWSPQLGKWHGPIMAVLEIAAGWALLGLTLASAATGRVKLMGTLFGIVWGGIILFVMFGGMVAYEFRPQFDAAGIILVGLAFSLALAAILVQTWRTRLVPERVTWLVVAGWIALFSGSATFSYAAGIARPEIIVYLAGLSALVVAPFVSVPLAVAWNRHR